MSTASYGILCLSTEFINVRRAGSPWMEWPEGADPRKRKHEESKEVETPVGGMCRRCAAVASTENSRRWLGLPEDEKRRKTSSHLVCLRDPGPQPEGENVVELEANFYPINVRWLDKGLAFRG